MVAVALVGVILLQRSEGGALGIGGGGGGFMTGRSAGNALTKTTAILAACFFATSLVLSILASQHRHRALDPEPDRPPVGRRGSRLSRSRPVRLPQVRPRLSAVAPAGSAGPAVAIARVREQALVNLRRG